MNEAVARLGCARNLRQRSCNGSTSNRRNRSGPPASPSSKRGPVRVCCRRVVVGNFSRWSSTHRLRRRRFPNSLPTPRLVRARSPWPRQVLVRRRMSPEKLSKMRFAIDLHHIPYRGDVPALTDILGGRVDLYFSALSGAIRRAKRQHSRAKPRSPQHNRQESAILARIAGERASALASALRSVAATPRNTRSRFNSSSSAARSVRSRASALST